MLMNELIYGGIVAACASVTGVGLLFEWRHRTYRRLLNYNPKQDCVQAFAGSDIETIPIHCDANGFVMPELSPGATSSFLELKVQASIFGDILDPSVRIEARGFRDEQFLERGVRGVRFLNLSPLLAAKFASGETVSLLGRHLSWLSDSARFHVCLEKLPSANRVLIIAPHPDDAEIAAYGLYADVAATVVTISAGNSDHRCGHVCIKT